MTRNLKRSTVVKRLTRNRQFSIIQTSRRLKSLEFMTTRYLQKLNEIGKARNTSATASKVRGVKWTESQLKKMRKIAAQPEMPTLSDLPKLGKHKAGLMLRKVKQLRKEMASATETPNLVRGIRDSKGRGIIYLVEHELFVGWVKCGMTTNMKKRLGAYNCSDPLNRFNVLAEKYVDDRRKAENLLKYNLESKATLSNGEWFRVDRSTALTVFKEII